MFSLRSSNVSIIHSKSFKLGRNKVLSTEKSLFFVPYKPAQVELSYKLLKITSFTFFFFFFPGVVSKFWQCVKITKHKQSNLRPSSCSCQICSSGHCTYREGEQTLCLRGFFTRQAFCYGQKDQKVLPSHVLQD